MFVWMDGWIDGWMDGWMDSLIVSFIEAVVCVCMGYVFIGSISKQ